MLRSRSLVALLVLFLAAVSPMRAQPRTVPIPGSLRPWAQPQFDRGRLPQDRRTGLITVLLKKSAAQQSELEKLLDDQQNPASAAYHRWLTPEQYAARFGAGARATNAVADWLRSQGLSVERVARGGNWVTFTGAVAAVESAFHTELHRYFANNSMHYAPYLPPAIPEALAAIVDNVAGLDDIESESEPQPMPKYNLGTVHGLAPDDFATIYNAAPLYAGGITGAGQKIAIAARSRVNLADIQSFRSLFGLAPNDPQVVLYGPDPGFNSGQGENTGDVEGVMAVARDAKVILVTTTDPYTSVAYAVDDQLAPVISFSSGVCEPAVALTLAQYQPFRVRSIAQQANAEGITWVAASGDYGAAGCDLGRTAVFGLAASFPATIPEITAAGGTQFAEGSGSYWNTSNTATGASARSYIPEVVWNETTAVISKAATGGGASTLFAKPAWQVAPGVPQDGARDVPDVSFNAANNHDPDVGIYNGVIASLAGTSVAAPSFAGVLALLNQYLVSKGLLRDSGLGNVNPVLYRLARSTPSVFHDITSGTSNRACQIGTPDCTSGVMGYAAGPGYDLATGLGSLDIFALVTNWNAARKVSVTILSTNSAALTLDGSIPLTVLVNSPAGDPPATGEVTFYSGKHLLGVAPLTSGSVTFTIYGSQLGSGTATITAFYSGDPNLDGSSASAAIVINGQLTHSVIIPGIAPNPVFRHTTPDDNGNTLFFTISLAEAAGIASTLTAFEIDGVAQSLSRFFPSTVIPAKGAISSAIATTAPTGPSARVYGFRGLDASGAAWHQEVTAYFLGPQFAGVSGVANAASGDATAVAPGSIASVYGANLSPGTLLATTVPLPLSLAGISVAVNGIPAPLFFVSSGQINLQLPYELQPGPATVVVNNNGQKSVATPQSSFTVAAVRPGIFVDGGGNTVPFAAGARGQTLVLFITGFGAVSPAVETGAAPAPGTPVEGLPAPIRSLTVTVGGKEAVVQFAGIPIGLVGTMQVNFQVPDDAPLGPQPVVVSVGGIATTGTATLTVNGQ
jgi:uncharacterized protein (TIGR03437 family)